MNCPSRVEPEFTEGWNQSPPHLAPETTTRADLNQAPAPRAGDRSSTTNDTATDGREDEQEAAIDSSHGFAGGGRGEVERSGIESAGERVSGGMEDGAGKPTGRLSTRETAEESKTGLETAIELPPKSKNANDASMRMGASGGNGRSPSAGIMMTSKDKILAVARVLKKYTKFIGPGFMVSVAYIDPGNYATDVAAGASFRFRLLFIILMSNLFAIFLQSLCIKLGSVTGLNLAENCRANMPSWLNYVLYVLAEAAIIATDIAEVIGTAIALNLLLKVPLVAGCAISIVDVLIILFFYNPEGSMKGVRLFEGFVILIVLGVVVCFCFQLSLLKGVTAGEVLRGYLPSSAIIKSKGLYQSCGILGATVMPHSLYLGSGIVQSRLKDFDSNEGTLLQRNSTITEPGEPLQSSAASARSQGVDDDDDFDGPKYRPSIKAIRACMSYSIVELGVSLFTFALFVNSAILIVAGASLSDASGASNADLFGIHSLLSSSLAPVAGTIFALALLLSGTSAGIVCTIAGQMVSEGQLRLRMRPWLRRLLTRSFSITPSIIIAGVVGKDGLSAALEGSQVALSVILPFVSAPLIYFTCRNRYMTVADGEAGQVKMRNHWITAVAAAVIWGIIVVMNIALLVLVGLGV